MAHRGAGLAPVFAAVEGGYFREQGLEPRARPLCRASRARSQALIAGEVDFINTVGARADPGQHRHRRRRGHHRLRHQPQRAAGLGAARPDHAGGAARQALGRHRSQRCRRCSIVMAFERWGWDIARDAEIVVVGSDGPRLDLLLDAQQGRCRDHACARAVPGDQARLERRRGPRPPRRRLPEQLRRHHPAAYARAAATSSVRYVRAYCQGVYRFRTDADFRHRRPAQVHRRDRRDRDRRRPGCCSPG